MFDFLTGFFKRDPPKVATVQAVNIPTAQFSSWNSNAYENDLYRAGVDAIARNAAKLKGVHVIASGGQRQPAEDRRINRLLQISPNEYMTAYDLLYKLTTHYFLYNNAFAVLDWDDAGKLAGIYPVNYVSSQMLLDNSGKLYVEFTFKNGRKAQFEYSDLIHIRRHFNGNEFLGDSNCALDTALEMAHTQNEGIIAAVRNSGALRGLLKLVQTTKAKDAKELRANFVKDYLNLSNNGGVAVLDSSADYIPLNQMATPLDSGQIATTKDKIYECSIVPYPAYKDTTVEARSFKGECKMKFENVGQAFNFYNNKTIAQIEKRAEEIESELSAEGADIQSLNIELEGMKAAKANIEESVGLLNNARNTLLNLIETSEGNTAPIDEEQVLSSDEYRTAFYKTLQGKKLNSAEARAMKFARGKFEKRAGEFNTSTNSAALIPTATLNEIISTERTQGGLISECRAFSVPSNVAIPVATPKEKAAWHSIEGQAVESEKIETTNVTFNGYEIIKIMSLSLKTQAMTVSAFESYLVDELKNCVMETIEDALINGTGSGQGTGIMTVFDSDNTMTLANPLSYSSVTASISKLGRGYAKGAKFAMNNKSLWTTFYTMKDNNARPLFVQDLQNQGIGKILGYDVVIDDNIPDNTIIFGNFKYMSYNLPQGIVIESSRESSFKSGLIDYRAIAIADCKPLLKEAFIKIEWTE